MRRFSGIILFLVVLFVSFFLYQDTYAKYRKKVVQSVDISLAKWNIKLNNQAIAGQSTISGNIVPTFETNEYMAEGVLAPGISGYFDIEIDASEVDVSFNYQLIVTVTDQEKYPDIVAYGYTIDPEYNTAILNINNTTISGDIVHNTPMTKLRIYIKWDDTSSNVMNNADDTAVAINNSSLSMNAMFTFSQINQ